MASKSDEDLYNSIYAFLVKNGLSGSAKSLLQEAKLNSKKASSGADLTEVFSVYKSQK